MSDVKWETRITWVILRAKDDWKAACWRCLGGRRPVPAPRPCPKSRGSSLSPIPPENCVG